MLDPKLNFIFEVNINLGKPQDLNITRYGKRRIINIEGGSVQGPEINGTILPGGADWQTIRTDGTTDISARYTIMTDDEELLYIQDKGIRTLPEQMISEGASNHEVEQSKFIMRTTAKIEANENSKYDWLNRSIIVSAGFRKEASIIIRFYKVI